MGCEFAQDNEWAEAGELDWWLLDHGEHRGVQQLVGDLNRRYVGTPALWEQDVTPAAASPGSPPTTPRPTWSRSCAGATAGEALVCVGNFSGRPHEDYRLPLPFAGRWSEVLNTDAEHYGGSGVGNLGTVTARPEPYGGQPASASLACRHSRPSGCARFRRLSPSTCSTASGLRQGASRQARRPPRRLCACPPN